MFYFLIFVLGTILASFCNVIGYRYPLHISFVKGRSHCEICHHQLYAWDLIPIVSYVLLKGRCRYCNASLSFKHPMIECIGGVITVLCFYQYELNSQFLFTVLLFFILLTASLIDISIQVVSDLFMICLFILSLFSLLIYSVPITDRLFGFFIIPLLMLLINICKESFGGADIKLTAVMGFLLGFERLVLAMIISIFVAGGYSIYGIISKRYTKNTYIAFIPFLSLGYFVSLLYGYQIITFYLRL